MLGNAWHWGIILREALAILITVVEKAPQILPEKLFDLPVFATQAEALDYLRGEVWQWLNDMIIVALWGEFETLLQSKNQSPIVEKRNESLLSCMKDGIVRPRLRTLFRGLSPEELKYICKRGEMLWDYRSWVAHGRSPYEAPERWAPEDAYEFLLYVLSKISGSHENDSFHRP